MAAPRPATRRRHGLATAPSPHRLLTYSGLVSGNPAEERFVVGGLVECPAEDATDEGTRRVDPPALG